MASRSATTRIGEILMVVLFTASASAQTPDDATWPQFRGPGGVASTAASIRAPTFDPEHDVLWQTDLPPGHSSPCVGGDRIYVTGWDGERLLMIALARTTGREVWRRGVLPVGVPTFDHKDAAIAMPTPCTNGARVFFYFGSYGLIATDPSGETVWTWRPGTDQGSFGVGTSPILSDDTVIVCRDGRAESAVFALAEKDGTLRWKAPRLTHVDTYATPFLWRNPLRSELVLAGSRRLTSLDPLTGDQLWQVDGLASVVCTTPTADADTLYFGAWSTLQSEGLERLTSLFGDSLAFTDEEQRSGAAAFRRLDRDGDGRVARDEIPPCRARDCFDFVDGDRDGFLTVRELAPILDAPKARGANLVVAVAAGGRGDVSDTHVRWRRRRGVPYVASPLLHEGRLYVVKSGGILTCLDPATGEPHFGPERLGDASECYASPVGVAGHVIICASAGTICVIKAADALEVVARVELGERIFATPAVAGGVVYLRTDRRLRAFGRPG